MAGGRPDEAARLCCVCVGGCAGLEESVSEFSSNNLRPLQAAATCVKGGCPQSCEGKDGRGADCAEHSQTSHSTRPSREPPPNPDSCCSDDVSWQGETSPDAFARGREAEGRGSRSLAKDDSLRAAAASSPSPSVSFSLQSSPASLGRRRDFLRVFVDFRRRTRGDARHFSLAP